MSEIDPNFIAPSARKVENYGQIIREYTQKDCAVFDRILTKLGELQGLLKEGDQTGYEVARYNSVRKSSDQGRECRYAKMSGIVFVKRGYYDKAKQLIQEINKLYELPDTGGLDDDTEK